MHARMQAANIELVGTDEERLEQLKTLLTASIKKKISEAVIIHNPLYPMLEGSDDYHNLWMTLNDHENDIQENIPLYALSGLFTEFKTNGLILVGAPGSGKSSFARKLGRAWLNRDNNFAKFDWVFILPLRHLARLPAEKLEGYPLYRLILNYYLGSSTRELEQHLENILQRCQSLIVFDGFDELSDNHAILILQLMSNMERFKFIVSTRPSAEAAVKLLNTHVVFSKKIELTLHGFDLETKLRYIKDFCKQMDMRPGNTIPNQEDAIQLLIRNNDVLSEIISIPSNLDMICSLWYSALEANERFQYTNLSSLYDKVIYYLCLNNLRRKQQNTADAVAKYTHILQALENLAFAMMQNNMVIFYNDDLQKYLPRGVSANDLVQLGFLVQTSRGDYSFHHLTMQEYFAARFLARQYSTNSAAWKWFLTNAYKPRLKMIWKFVAGILSTPTQQTTWVLTKDTRNEKFNQLVAWLNDGITNDLTGFNHLMFQAQIFNECYGALKHEHKSKFIQRLTILIEAVLGLNESLLSTAIPELFNIILVCLRNNSSLTVESEIAAIFIRGITQTNAEVKEATYTCLADTGTRNRDLIDALLTAYENETDGNQTRIIITLGQIPNHDQAILTFLFSLARNKQSLKRHTALLALQMLGITYRHQEYEAIIHEALSDQDPEIVILALKMLKQFETPPQALVNRCKDLNMLEAKGEITSLACAIFIKVNYNTHEVLRALLANTKGQSQQRQVQRPAKTEKSEDFEEKCQELTQLIVDHGINNCLGVIDDTSSVNLPLLKRSVARAMDQLCALSSDSAFALTEIFSLINDEKYSLRTTLIEALCELQFNRLNIKNTVALREFLLKILKMSSLDRYLETKIITAVLRLSPDETEIKYLTAFMMKDGVRGYCVATALGQIDAHIFLPSIDYYKVANKLLCTEALRKIHITTLCKLAITSAENVAIYSPYILHKALIDGYIVMADAARLSVKCDLGDYDFPFPPAGATAEQFRSAFASAQASLYLNPINKLESRITRHFN